MKTLLKYTIAVFAFGMFATTAFAGSVNESPSVPTVLVTDGYTKDDWSTSTSIGEGDKLAVQLHYYLEEGDSTSNMRFRIEDLAGRTYSTGDQEDVFAEISANGLSSKQDSRTVRFTDDVRLEFHGVTWQIYPCQSTSCEEQLPSDYRNITSSGMNIGAVEGWADGKWQGKHYAGNVIVEFKAYEVQANYDDCYLDGVTIEHGDSHRFYSTQSTYGQCSAYDLVRTCTDGDLSGSDSYKYATCNAVSEDDASVSTLSATSIDEDSARLRGDLDLNDWDDADVYFRWGYSSGNLSYTTADRDTNTNGVFSRVLNGLNDDTRYYYQAVARDDNGAIEHGSIKSFRTDEDDNYSSDDNDVTTRTATNIDDDSARLRGEWEGDDNTDVWFAFDENDSTPSCNASSQRVGRTTVDDNDDFAETVTGLDENEKYYFRACGEDVDGDVLSGRIRDFVTDEEEDDNDYDEIDITTLRATNVDEDSARIRGEMDGDDNIDVWFAFDENDSTPSCNASSQRVGRTTVDDNDDFAETVTGLDENEKYYFRACGEDTDGDVVSGSIRNFVTDEDDDDDNDDDERDEDVELNAVTNIASGISTNAARFNAYAFGEGDALCYFQYGRSASLGLSTGSVSMDLDQDTTCSSYRTNLSANTTYYYRVVVVQDGEYEYGSIQNFRTNQVVTPVTPVTPTTPEDDDEDRGIEVTKWVSAETDPRFDTYTQAQSGETVYYKVRVENNTNRDLDDLEVVDRIPFYLEIDTDRASDDDEDDKTVQWIIDLDEGESRTFITEMRVREDARRGDIIVSYASAEAADYSANSNDVEIEVEAGEYMADEDETDSDQRAFLFAAGIFPDTLTGWGILILILLAILYMISRIIIARNEHARVIAELEAARRSNSGGTA
jgi:hypothetical protein